MPNGSMLRNVNESVNKTKMLILNLKHRASAKMEKQENGKRKAKENRRRKIVQKTQWRKSTNFGHLSTPFTQNDKKILSEVHTFPQRLSRLKFYIPLNHLNLILFFVCHLSRTHKVLIQMHHTYMYTWKKTIVNAFQQ